jgi:hypothetical protein
MPHNTDFMHMAGNLPHPVNAHRDETTAEASLAGKRHSMNLSTRLILLLTIAVGVVMILGGFFILRQREEILARALRNELYAHAITLQLTLEDSYRAGRIGDAQRLIDHLSENPRVFSVILFDERGRVAMFSNPLEAGKIVESPEAQSVIATGEPVEILQRRSGREVYAIIMPVSISPARRGAFEISQPTDIIKKARGSACPLRAVSSENTRAGSKRPIARKAALPSPSGCRKLRPSKSQISKCRGIPHPSGVITHNSG